MSVSVANGARALVVLVVEDEFIVRCNVADFLSEAGYVVVETASGEEAIDLCKSDMLIDLVSRFLNPFHSTRLPRECGGKSVGCWPGCR